MHAYKHVSLTIGNKAIRCADHDGPSYTAWVYDDQRLIELWLEDFPQKCAADSDLRKPSKQQMEAK